jgi:hypothetical protein
MYYLCEFPDHTQPLPLTLPLSAVKPILNTSQQQTDHDI